MDVTATVDVWGCSLDPGWLTPEVADYLAALPSDLPPKSMLKDIVHLLKVSRIG